MSISNIEKERFFRGLVLAGRLSLSEDGEVYNPKTSRRIGYVSNTGYPAISFKDHVTGIIWKIQIHRLVWIAFKGLIPQGMEINHKDENKLNPRLSNLDLVTGYQNGWYSRNGKSYNAHLDIEAEWVDLVKRGHSCAEIGRLYGRATSIVSRRLKKYGMSYAGVVHRRSKVPKDMDVVSEHVLRSGYLAVARERGVNRNTVRNWFRLSGMQAPELRKRIKPV